MLRPKVLFIVNHAADYHESFYSGLSRSVNLTVLARNCEKDSLTSPVERGDYRYIEARTRGSKNFFYQENLIGEILSGKYQFVVCVLNLRNLSILLGFFRYKISKLSGVKWFWWGIIFGEKENLIKNFVRKSCLESGDGVLVHSNMVKRLLIEKFSIASHSYNNSNVQMREFKPKKQVWCEDKFKLLFVGTNKKRKNLDTLLRLAERHDWLDFRCVGLGMEALEEKARKKYLTNITFFGHSTGADLDDHFEWANAVIAPGNVGLLASTASKYSTPVLFNENAYHGPEIELLLQASQLSLDFSKLELVAEKLLWLLKNPTTVEELGEKLCSVGKADFSVEHMVSVHCANFGVS